MARTGLVISTHGTRAKVATNRRGPCSDCSEEGACALTIGGAPTAKADLVEVENPINARPGDTVEIDLVGHTELRVSLLVWIVPLVGLIAGAIAGAALHDTLSLGQDPAAMVGGTLGIFGAYALLMAIDRHSRNDHRLVPHIQKVVVAEACSSAAPAQRRAS